MIYFLILCHWKLHPDKIVQQMWKSSTYWSHLVNCFQQILHIMTRPTHSNVLSHSVKCNHSTNPSSISRTLLFDYQCSIQKKAKTYFPLNAWRPEAMSNLSITFEWTIWRPEVMNHFSFTIHIVASLFRNH